MTTILITGANRGIGLEFTRHYAGSGATVHAACRNPSAAKELNAVEGDVTVHALDIADHSAVDTLAASLNAPIDILIANAGIYGKEGADQGFSDLDLDGVRHTIEVNTIGTLKTLMAFLPHVKKGQGKKMVAITSKMGSIDDASGGSIAYRTSKTALNMAMACAANDVESAGIAVGTLHPGWVRTDMGGPNGMISVEESVAGLVKVIDDLKPAPKAAFKDYAGNDIPW